MIESRRRNGTVVTGKARGAHNLGGTDTPEVSAAVVHLIQSARRAELGDDTLLNLVRARLDS